VLETTKVDSWSILGL